MPRKTKKTKKVNKVNKVSHPSLSVLVEPSQTLSNPLKPSPIKSSLKVLGKTCTAEGPTIQEAILNLKPELAKGVGILTLQKGNVKREKVVRPQIINNLFGKYVSRVSREVAIKQILMIFDKSVFE